MCRRYQPVRQAEGGPLPVDEALDIAIQIGKGLAKAHKNDIVHRDIKPGNILIAEDGNVKIVDFGLAKLGSVTKMTIVGTTMGTVGYMSPEQARGDEVDSRSDIWALCVVLYEMLSGRIPFRGDVDAAVIYSIMNEEPDPLTEACPECPAELEDVISTSLAKETAERFQSIDELVAALEAVRGGESVPTIKRSAGRSGGRFNRRIAAGIIAVVVIAAAVLGHRFLRPGQTIESIAVLPIMDLSGDNEEGSFADGFTGVLINEMGKIEDVMVTGHRSVMQYKDSQKSLPDIADELKVDALIEASIIRDGDKVLLTVQLVGVNPERQLWTDSFNRPYKDILAMYGEVTRAIADHVEAAISPAAAAALASRQTVDLRAYENFLYGFYWINASIDYSLDGDLGKAKKYFNASLAIDSTYAPAWAGLAEVHIMSSHGYPPPPNAVEDALEAVERAMELDPDVSEAYRTLAHILWEHVWDMEGAEKAFKRGFELNPSDAYLLLIYSYYCSALGRYEEGAEAARRACELDPLSFKVNVAAMQPIAVAGQVDEAAGQILKAKEMFPDTYKDYGFHLFLIYSWNGEYDRAIEELDKHVLTIGKTKEYFIGSYAATHFFAGHDSIAQALLDEMDVIAERDSLPIECPKYYSLRGDFDTAFELLEMRFESKDMWLTRLMITPGYLPLHDDPRFMDLARRIGVRE